MKYLSDDWFALGANYYRRLTFYKLALNESINFNDFLIAIGGRGGLIAFLQCPRQTGKSLLIITSAAGHTVAETLWKDAPPIAVAWSESEEIVVVQKSGYATMLNLSGVFNRRFSFGKEAENTQIIDAKFFSFEGHTAVAAVTGSSQILVATSVERPRILAISCEIPLANRAFVWQVVSSVTMGNLDAFKGPWILLAVDKEVHCMGVGKAVKAEFPNYPSQNLFSAFHKLAIAPNEALVAFYLDSSVLRVTSLGKDLEVQLELNFSERVVALGGKNSNIASLPSDMVWLDNSTVGLQWKNFVVIVDMEKNVYEFFYPSYVRIQAEVDGLRVLTPASHELIQRVPQELESLGRIGASCPAVLLLFAYREWAAGSGRAHDFLRSIHSAEKMHAAISDCLVAAGHCALASTETQKTLLAAAQFGRGFFSVMLAAPGACANGVDSNMLDNLSKKTVQVTTTLRLLNNISVDWVGMALTWKQFESLGPLALLNRLLARKHYPLAVELVRVYQKMPLNNPEYRQIKTTGMTRILCHWVKCLPPQSNQPTDPNNPLMRRTSEIISRCGSAGGLSFAEVAETAIQCNQLALAEYLLDLEPRVSAQIPLLMRLKKYSLALGRAVESGDTDLLLLGVLRPLQEGEARMEPTALSLLLRQHPIALALYRQHLEEGPFTKQPKGKLASQTLAVLQQEDDPALAIKKEVIGAFASKDPSIRSSGLIKAKDSYQQLKSEFLSQTCEEAAKLVNLHKRLEQQRVTAPYFRLNDSAPGAQVLPRVVEAAAFRWHGSSVNTTYVRLVAAGSQTTERIADQMRRDFRIPEKRAAYLRLIGLALSSNTPSAWAEIERMAFSKRPVVPLDVIVKVYADAGRHNEAADIIAKLPLEQKIRALVMIGKSHEAINIATQERSDRLLYLIQRLLHKTDRPAADQVGRIRQQLSLNSPSS